MKKGMLITLPQSDDVTEYLTAFSAPIIEACKKHLIKFKQLKNKNATKEKFEASIKSYGYNTIVFNGHGNVDCITGYKNKEIIKIGVNEELLLNRIVYARSCWSAKGIGGVLEKKGGCFIGYNIPFMFLIDTTWATNPIKDKTAKIFFDTSNIVPLGIIKGQTTRYANDNSKKSMLKSIKKALLKNDKDSHNIAEILWNNYSGQVLIGNPDLKI